MKGLTKVQKLKSVRQSKKVGLLCFLANDNKVWSLLLKPCYHKLLSGHWAAVAPVCIYIAGKTEI